MRPGTSGFSEKFSGEASRETGHGKSTSPVPQFLWIRFTSWEVNPRASPGCITHSSAALSEMPSGSILPASGSGGATEGGPGGAVSHTGRERVADSCQEGRRWRPREAQGCTRGCPPQAYGPGHVKWHKIHHHLEGHREYQALNSLIIKAKTPFFSLTALQSGFKKHTLEKLFKSTSFSCSLNSRNFSIIGCFQTSIWFLLDGEIWLVYDPKSEFYPIT